MDNGQRACVRSAPAARSDDGQRKARRKNEEGAGAGAAGVLESSKSKPKASQGGKRVLLPRCRDRHFAANRAVETN
jgi:hypothetical protein